MIGEIIQFLITLVVNLVILILNLAIRIIELGLMMFPSPEGMPGLGLTAFPDWVSLGWVASIIDLNAAGGLLTFMLTVRLVEALPALLIRLWSLIKW